MSNIIRQTVRAMLGRLLRYIDLDLLVSRALCNFKSRFSEVSRSRVVYSNKNRAFPVFYRSDKSRKCSWRVGDIRVVILVVAKKQITANQDRHRDEGQLIQLLEIVETYHLLRCCHCAASTPQIFCMVSGTTDGVVAASDASLGLVTLEFTTTSGRFGTLRDFGQQEHSTTQHENF